jgi:hypothetical protein
VLGREVGVGFRYCGGKMEEALYKAKYCIYVMQRGELWDLGRRYVYYGFEDLRLSYGSRRRYALCPCLLMI